MAHTASSHRQPTIVTLSLLLYRGLLSLGPAAFRRDYAAPALQDFRQCCRVAYQKQKTLGVLRLWPGLVSETVSGLLAEHIIEFMGRKRFMLPTLRRSIVATFGAFVLFLFADAAFGRIVDPADPFDAIGHVHPEIALAHRIVSFSTTIVFLAVVLGGLPLLLTAMKHALSGGPRSVVRLFGMRPKQVLRWLRVALLITICSLGFLLVTQAIFGPPPCTSTNGCLAGQPPLGVALGFTALIGGGTLGVFVVLMLSASLSLAVLRSEFGTGMLRFALVLLGILALSMATASVAAAMWTIRLWVDAPQFAASTSGLGNGQTAWVIAIIAAMAVSTVVAVGAFTSGLRASWGRAG